MRVIRGAPSDPIGAFAAQLRCTEIDARNEAERFRGRPRELVDRHDVEEPWNERWIPQRARGHDSELTPLPARCQAPLPRARFAVTSAPRGQVARRFGQRAAVVGDVPQRLCGLAISQQHGRPGAPVPSLIELRTQILPTVRQEVAPPEFRGRLEGA